MTEEEKQALAWSVSKIIETDAIDLAGILLNPIQFAARVKARDAVDSVRGSDDPVVQGILWPLRVWDMEES